MPHRISIANLPAPEDIDHEVIRSTAEEHAAAQLRLRDAQRAYRDLDRDREQAKDADAQEHEAALVEGRKPGTRRHVAAHEKKADDCEHNVRVAQLSLKRATEALQGALDEHGEAWAESHDERVAKLDSVWNAALSALEQIHHKRTAEYARMTKVFARDVPAVGAIKLTPSALHGVEVLYPDHPEQRRRLRATVTVDDLLAALGRMGEVETFEMPGASVLGEAFRAADEHARNAARAHADRYQHFAPSDASVEYAQQIREREGQLGRPLTQDELQHEFERSTAANRGALFVRNSPVAVYNGRDGGED